jgi:hypothetical protein
VKRKSSEVIPTHFFLHAVRDSDKSPVILEQQEKCLIAGTEQKTQADQEFAPGCLPHLPMILPLTSRAAQRVQQDSQFLLFGIGTVDWLQITGM